MGVSRLLAAGLGAKQLNAGHYQFFFGFPRGFGAARARPGR